LRKEKIYFENYSKSFRILKEYFLWRIKWSENIIIIAIKNKYDKIHIEAIIHAS
jgi:hypothetical protein